MLPNQELLLGQGQAAQASATAITDSAFTSLPTAIDRLSSLPPTLTGWTVPREDNSVLNRLFESPDLLGEPTLLPMVGNEATSAEGGMSVPEADHAALDCLFSNSELFEVLGMAAVAAALQPGGEEKRSRRASQLSNGSSPS
jgi:hypothetical protein